MNEDEMENDPWSLNEISLEKEKGRAKEHGLKYEYKWAALIAARLRARRRKNPELNIRFQLWTNVLGANPFDDIVVRIHWKKNGKEGSVTYLIQLKHKENTAQTIGLQSLGVQTGSAEKTTGGDFNLRRYHLTLKKAQEKIQKTPEAKLTATQRFLRDCFQGEYRLGLLTTQKCLPERKSTKNSSSLEFNFEDIFTTPNGETFSFGKEDAAIWNLFNKNENIEKEGNEKKDGNGKKEENEEEYNFRNNFIPRLRIFSGQVPVYKLDSFIKKALQDALDCELSVIDNILTGYINEIAVWWNRDNGDGISHKTLEIEKLVLQHVNELIQNVSFSIEERNKFIEKLKITNSICVVVPGISSSFRCALLKQVLDETHTHKYSILTENALKQYRTDTLKSMCLNLCNVVVINIDNKEEVGKIVKICLQKVKCIVAVGSAKAGEDICDSLGIKNIITIIQEWSLDQLTDQTTILEKKIFFQGECMSLAEVEHVWPSLRRHVGGAALGALLAGRQIAIGRPPPPLAPHYVPRTVQHCCVLNPSVLELHSNEYHFVLRNFPEETLKKLRQQTRTWQECSSEDWMPVISHNEQNFYNDNSTKTKWLEWYPDLKIDTKNRNVHWITCIRYTESNGENDISGTKISILWEKSVGDNRSILPYILKQNSECGNSPVCNHKENDFLNWTEKSVVLLDKTGMGKTSFLVRMAHMMKLDSWIVFLAPSALKEIGPKKILAEDITMDYVINILSKSATPKADEESRLGIIFIKEYFKNLQGEQDESTGRLVVIIDGVDEVVPSYKENVLTFVGLLRGALVQRGGRLWVAARRVLEEDLCRTLRCAAPLSLSPFSLQDQSTYILHCWAKDHQPHAQAVEIFLLDVANSTSNTGKSLCEIPLYANLLTEVYTFKNVTDFVNNKSSTVVWLLNLFKRFVMRTLTLKWDKRNIHPDDHLNLGIEGYLEEEFKRHKIYGALQCFTDHLGEEYSEMRNIANDNIEVLAGDGIVDRLEEGIIVFHHRSFTEYLSACWLFDKFEQSLQSSGFPRSIAKELYTGELEECRYFFDAFLAEGHMLHEAALTDVNTLNAAFGSKDNSRAESEGSGKGKGDFGDSRKCESADRQEGEEHQGDGNKSGNEYGRKVVAMEEALNSRKVDGAHGGKEDALGRDGVGGSVDDADKGGRRPLHLASIAGHVAAVALLLEARANVASIDGVLGWTPLRYADAAMRVRHRNGVVDSASHVDVMEQLLRAKADPRDMPRTKQHPALMVFAIQNNFTLVAIEIMKTESKDFNIQRNKNTALRAAARLGNLNACEALLTCGAEISATGENGSTALHFAAENGHGDIVKYLLQNHADPNCTNNFKITPLIMAAFKGQKEICEVLLDEKALIDFCGENLSTALHFAAEKGLVDICELLLKRNANPNIQNQNRSTPLIIASHCGHEKVCEVLLKHNADADIKGENGSAALQFAVEMHHVDVCRVLLGFKADPNTVNNFGNSPLIGAAHRGHLSVCEILLTNRANVDFQGENLSTALHFAAEKGHGDICQTLLHNNANPNIQNNSKSTPLIIAAYHGFESVCEILITNNANLNVQGENNSTALHFAVDQNHEDVVRLLLKRNADRHIINTSGVTALGLAEEKNLNNLITLLRP